MRFSLTQSRPLAFAASSLVACVGPETEELQSTQRAIVYGEDDRADLFETAPTLRELTARRSVALISPDHLEAQEDGTYRVVGPKYGELQSLCEGERFFEQVAAVSCSGVLIAPDTVATAAHCLGVTSDGRPDCTNHRYVLGYGLEAPNASPTIPQSSVFECQDVLTQLRSEAGAPCHLDLALLRIRRTGDSNEASLSLRERPLEVGEGLVVVGYPGGLPAKVDVGARVQNTPLDRHDFFELDSDTFAVSSGSAIFDAQGELVGVFTRGYSDYVVDDESGCQRIHRVEPEDATGFEQAIPTFALRRLLASVGAGTIDEDSPSIVRETCGAASTQSDAGTPPSPSDPADDAGAPPKTDAGAGPHGKSVEGCGLTLANTSSRAWLPLVLLGGLLTNLARRRARCARARRATG